MSGLSAQARDRIRAAGLTKAAYVRTFWPDGVWRGDECGCTDDRCVGFHHEEGDPCGCLEALLADVEPDPTVGVA